MTCHLCLKNSKETDVSSRLGKSLMRNDMSKTTCWFGLIVNREEQPIVWASSKTTCQLATSLSENGIVEYHFKLFPSNTHSV